MARCAGLAGARLRLDLWRRVNGSPEKRSPLAEAVQWVSRITTVALEMVLPGLAGHWLDQRLGTGFLVLVGFVLGLTCGLWHLLAMTRPSEPKKTKTSEPSEQKDPEK